MESPVIVRARAKITPVSLGYEDLVALAKSKAPDPTVFDEYDAVFWRAQVSNNRLDFYATSMAERTLKNYVEDLDDGVSFQDSHEWRKNGWGQSIKGELVKHDDETVPVVDAPLREVYGTFFTLAGVQSGDQKTDDFIANIRSGVWRDVSIGFYARDVTCSICGKQSFEWWKEDGCPHMPGVEYDDDGRSVMAWASINDGRMMETSQVYDGATPEASIHQVIAKANALAAERMISEREIAAVERRYSVRVARPAPVFAVGSAEAGGVRAMGEKVKGRKIDDADVRDSDESVEAGIPVDGDVSEGQNATESESQIERDEQTVEAETPEETTIDEEEPLEEAVADEDEDTEIVDERDVTPTEARDILAGERERLREHGIKLGRDPVQAVRALSDALIASRRRNADLAKDADLGKRYRDNTIAEAIAEGIRARGNAFREETYRSMLERLDMDQIETIRDDFRAEADEKMAPTRRVTESDDIRELFPEGGRKPRNRGAHRA